MNQQNQIRPFAGSTLIPLTGGKKMKKNMVFAGLAMFVGGIILDVGFIGLPVFSAYLSFPGAVLAILGVVYKSHFLKIDRNGVSGHNGKRKFDFKWDQIEDFSIHSDVFLVSNGKEMISIPFSKIETGHLAHLKDAVGNYLPASGGKPFELGNRSDEFF